VSGHPGDRLSAFLDGELSAAERAEMQGHLRECPACTRELEELGAVDAFARELPVEAPAGYFEELPGRVRARVRRPARAPRMALWAVAAAAAVMAVVVTPVVLQHERAVMTPAAQAVPEVPAPAATVPPLPQAVPPPASFADKGAAFSRAQPVPARREADERLQEREKSDSPAANVLSKTQAQSNDRRDAAPAAAPAAAPPPAVAGAERNAAAGFEARDAVSAPTSTMAESVEVQAAKPDAVTKQEGARPEAGADAKKERARPAERKLAAGSGAFAHPDDRALMTDKRYEALVARPAASAAEARALGEAWELFARDVPAGPRADEARVRAIEAAVRAWTLGHDPADLAHARERGRAYLEMENAPQAARVRTALAALP
jgi:Putative zinc-finger